MSWKLRSLTGASAVKRRRLNKIIFMIIKKTTLSPFLVHTSLTGLSPQSSILTALTAYHDQLQDDHLLSACNPPVRFTSPSLFHISYPKIPQSNLTQASASASSWDPTGVFKTISIGQSAQCSAKILTPWVFGLQTNCWVGLHWLYSGWSMLGHRGPPLQFFILPSKALPKFSSSSLNRN